MKRSTRLAFVTAALVVVPLILGRSPSRAQEQGDDPPAPTEEEGTAGGETITTESTEPDDAVTVVGAGADGLALQAPDAAWTTTLTIQAGDEDLTGVTLTVSDLRTATGRTVTPDTTEWTWPTLARGATEQVTLEADLPEVAAYEAVIVVNYEGGAAPAVPLSVTRSATTPSVELSGAPNTEHVRHRPGVGPARIELTLEETEGAPVALSRPALLDLARADGDISIQAHGRVTIERRDENGPWTAVGETLELDAGQRIELRYSIADLGPGTYSGTVSLREPGGTAVTKDVKIFVRLGIWILLIVLTVGLGLGHLTRSVLTVLRARTERRRRTSQAIVDLTSIGATRGAQERSLLAALMEQADILEQRVSESKLTDTDLDTDIGDLEARAALVPIWVRLHRLVRSIQPSSLVSGPASTLASVHGTLGEATTPAAKVAEVATTLTELNRTLSTTVRDAIAGELTEARNALAAEEAHLQPSSKGKADAVHRRLERAQRRLDDNDLPGSASALSRAGEELVDLLTADLVAYLDALPEWVGGVGPQLSQKVLAVLAGAGTEADRLTRTQRALVGELIRVAASKTVDEPAKTQVDEQLAKARAALDTDVAAARTALAEAVRLANDFRTQTVIRSGRTAVLAGARMPSVGTRPVLGLRVPTVRVLADRGARARTDLAAAIRRAKVLSWVGTGVAFLAAIAIGYFQLYDRDWGTYRDVVIALFWGLGLDVTTATFTGLLPLRDQIEGGTAAAPSPAVEGVVADEDEVDEDEVDEDEVDEDEVDEDEVDEDEVDEDEVDEVEGGGDDEKDEQRKDEEEEV